MRAAILASLVVIASAVRAAPDQPTPIGEAEFNRLRKAIPPQELGYWEDIAWEVDLLAACARAEREKKLVFIWSMSGHPLGCT
ncbi:MAG: hypothetical protein OER88_12495 [Planctomycetota bacterium]|nr:hypothetical protein [Planctomycetota bacterium]